jgi:NAD(P)-dependent dehydrogenase (short-subunit alcohol dehydrogenase family)
MGRIEGKIAVVTGGAQGLGEADSRHVSQVWPARYSG